MTDGFRKERDTDFSYLHFNKNNFEKWQDEVESSSIDRLKNILHICGSYLAQCNKERIKPLEGVYRFSTELREIIVRREKEAHEAKLAILPMTLDEPVKSMKQWLPSGVIYHYVCRVLKWEGETGMRIGHIVHTATGETPEEAQASAELWMAQNQ